VAQKQQISKLTGPIHHSLCLTVIFFQLALSVASRYALPGYGDTSLNLTHLSIRRGRATTTYYTHHQVGNRAVQLVLNQFLKNTVVSRELNNVSLPKNN